MIKIKFSELRKLGKNIKRNINANKNNKPLNTGLIGEQMIIASYEQMSIKELEGMRIIINHLVKKKKHFKKISETEAKIKTTKNV